MTNTYNPIKAGQINVVVVSDGCEVSIRRPNGEIEVVSNPAGIREMNKILFAKIVAANKAAGKGSVLSYINKTKKVEYVVSAADAATDSTAKIERLMRAGE